jgi:hypothetical protein
VSIDAFSDPVWDAIKTYLTANWTATPLAYPNEWYDPAEGTSWVYVELTRAVYGQESIGETRQSDNRWDEEGVLWLHLNVGKSVDVSKIGGAARALADLFRGTTLLSGSLEFLDANIDAGGQSEDGNWFRQSCAIDWRHMDA